MRFWKFIKDELNENQEQQSSNNNAISEEQKISNKSQQEDDEEQQGESQQEDGQEKEFSSSSSEQNQESSQQSSDSQQSEEQEMSDSNSGKEDNQEKESSSSSSEQNQESSQQSNDSQQNDGQDMSNELQQGDNEEQQGESQQEDGQEKEFSSSNSEQNQESSQQTNDSQQSEEQEMSDSNSGKEDNQEKESSSSSSEQNQESSQQTNDSQQGEEQKNDNQSQKVENGENDFSSNEVQDDKNEISSEEKIEQLSEKIVNDHKLTNEQKRDLLEKLKKSIEEIRKRKAEKLHREHINHENQELKESKEEKYELSEQTNEFLNQLGDLPSFENRDRGPGYSIDTESYTEIPESVIRTLITKFLNQRFCKCNTDLNVRSNSSEKANGFYSWEVKDVIVHLQTHQITKVLTDKYGYDYEQGKGDNIPLSFYFDMSESMSKYTNMLAVISIELLKKGVKVLIGYNERVNVQIESIEKNITISELAQILKSAGYWSYWGISDRNKFKKDHRVKFKYVEKNIDNYLIEKKAEKCVVFADFDPKNEIINLSQVVDVYWFCFERSFSPYNVGNFNGFIYSVQNIKDLEKGLLKINEKRFETLCYTDNPKSLQKKVREKR